MILNATGLSFRSSTKLSRSWIAIFEKQLYPENDTNFAAGVPISSAICEKVALNSLLPTELITFENTNKQKFKELSSKKESIFLIISLTSIYLNVQNKSDLFLGRFLYVS